MGGCKEIDENPKKKKQKQVQHTQEVKSQQNVSVTFSNSNSVDFKIIVIGPSDCGKSTILRHFDALFGTGITQDERNDIKKIIKCNVISDAKKLVSIMKESKYNFDDDLDSSIKYIEDVKVSDDELVSDITISIMDIWSNIKVKELYEKNASGKSIESAAYFFDNVERIAAENYVPTNEDILRSRIPTTSPTTYFYNFDTKSVAFVDLGGQRNFRKQWANYFQDVKIILFVASLSDFDQLLPEEESFKRTQDSLTLFSQIANSEMFIEVPIFFVLNKIDLFEKKLKRIPDVFKEAYPGFTGHMNNLDEVIDHVRKNFVKQLDPRPPRGLIEAVKVCAYDESSVRELMQKIAKKALTCD